MRACGRTIRKARVRGRLTFEPIDACDGREDNKRKKMKTVFLSKIYDNNMIRLKTRFPEIYDRLAGPGRDLPFPFQVIETPFKQANIAATLPDGSKVNFYDNADIVEGLREKMKDWQLDSEDYLFCVGLGLGYLPLLVSQEFKGKPHIVVFEPNPEIFQLALQVIDLRPLLAYERLDLYLGPHLPVSDIIGKYGERIFFGKNRLVSHGPSRLLYGEPFRSLENDIVENIRVARNIGFTAKQGGKKIFSNTMKNLSSLFSGPDLGALRGRFSGCPAICVAAGPSLDKDLNSLRAVGNRALILCADSAVRSLVNEGIRPHVVVTTDMNPVNFEKLRTSIDHLRESVLVYSIEANPENVGTFPGRRRMSVTSTNAILNQWLGPKWSLDWQLPAMTSVSHTALFTALALGAGPIILVGMDFAFSSGKSHASGSVFRYPATIDEALQVDGVRGYPVHSLPQLITDRKQIENAMAGSTVRYVDTSLDGALIKGAENRSLQEVLDTALQTDTDVSSLLESIDWGPSVHGKAVIAEIGGMAESVEGFISACHAAEKTCRLNDRITDGTSEGDAYGQHLQKTRNTLAAFEKKNGLLLSLLKLIRYGDVKEISRRLEILQTGGGKTGDERGRALKELGVYADHYASLEKAAQHFKKALLSAKDFFIGEAEHIGNLGRFPIAAGQMLTLARHYRKNDVFWKAEPTFLQYLETQPDDMDAWLNLGRMVAEKRLWPLARGYAEKMVKRFAGESKIVAFETEVAQGIEGLCDTALALLADGAIEEARRKVYEYLSLSGDDNRLHDIQKKIDAYDQANIRAMIQPEATRLSVDQKQVLGKKIRDCLEIGAVEKAIGILEGLAIEEDENAWEAREKIGDIRMGQGDVSSAVWHYRQALASSARNSVLTSKINAAFRQEPEGHQQGETMTESKENHRTGAMSSMDTPETMYRDAQAKIEQEAYADAVQILERLLLCAPDFALAHNDLGVLYFNQGKSELSFSHYKEAARIEPGNPVFRKNLADFHYIVNGDVQTSLEIYVDLLASDPEDKETLLALGHICTQQEKFDDAQVFFRRVLEIDPMNIDADRGLNALPGRQDQFEKELSSTKMSSAAVISPDGEAESAPIIPSKIIKTELIANNRRYEVRIPEQEVFRIKNIIDDKEYAVPEKRRGTGSFTVFDVGANVGIFSLSVHALHPQSRIYCFEPSPLAQTLLEANVGDFPEMVICKYGLLNRDMETTLHVNRYNTGQNSIRFAGKHHAGDVPIQVMDAGRQFDALGLSHLDILKIDTEGCEVEIIESMGERLDMVDYVLAEYHTEKDRRTIDELLKPFHLFGAHAVMPDFGTVKYVHPTLV
jgi:FkbM family methyltransferase